MLTFPAKKERNYEGMAEKHEGDKHAKVDMNTVSTACGYP
jgi:hypothetical protein